MVNVVLVNPEIPPNTGNIARLCCAVGAPLHLIEPLGFSIDDRSLKRAGLDYWEDLTLHVHPDLDAYITGIHPDRMVLTSSKRGRSYHRITYRPDDHILFGPETTGLPPELFLRFPGRIACVPVDHTKVRSLNLATSVGIVVYEALRQTGLLPETAE